MSASTLPVHQQWIAQTLTPYLRYAFKHVLRRNFDIAPYVQRAIDLSRSTPDSSTDGDDLVFERVFFAIERRHRGLPAELNGLTDNLESLAGFLIRRAQLKGPFELLHRDIPPSEAWKKYESVRLTQIATQNAKAPKYPAPTTVSQSGPSTFTMAATPSTMDHCIDPRLLCALPGEFTDAELSGSLTLPELHHYQRRNREIEAFWSRKLTQVPNQQQGYLMQQPSPGAQGPPQTYQHDTMLPGLHGQHNGTVNGATLQFAPNPAFQQHYAPHYMQHSGHRKTMMSVQGPPQALSPIVQMYTPVQPTQPLLQSAGFPQPIGYPFHVPVQNLQSHHAPNASQPRPAHPGPTSTRPPNARSGLPTLTKYAGICKPASKTPTTASLPDFSNPAQRALSMAAFKKLSREEKVVKILELNRAVKAKNPTAITPVEQFFIDQAAAASAKQAATARVTGPGEVTVKPPPDQQAITVPAPGYQVHQNAHMTTPGDGNFAHHPGYSNITSSLPPSSHRPPMVPTLVAKQEKK